jgi:hypothetical protein
VVILLLFILPAFAGPPEDFRRIVEAEPGAFALCGDLAAGRAVLAGDVRVLDRRVPAGSWVKLFQAYILVAEGRIDPGTRFRCDGWQGPGPRCWYGPGHGELDLAGALAHSCNAWFVQARTRLDSGAYLAVLAQLLPDSTAGRAPPPASGGPAPRTDVPSEAWVGAWERGELTAASPRFGDLCRAVAGLVLGSRMVFRSSGDTRDIGLVPVSLDGPARTAVLEGMRRAAAEGTAVALAREFGSTDLLAKTSSMVPAEAPARERNRNRLAMICAFYPAEAPRAFVFLLVPRGFAPETAAPLAGRALRAFCLQRNLLTTKAQRTQSSRSNPFVIRQWTFDICHFRNLRFKGGIWPGK